jgi:hypothetical protein
MWADGVAVGATFCSAMSADRGLRTRGVDARRVFLECCGVVDSDYRVQRRTFAVGGADVVWIILDPLERGIRAERSRDGGSSDLKFVACIARIFTARGAMLAMIRRGQLPVENMADSLGEVNA